MSTSEMNTATAAVMRQELMRVVAEDSRRPARGRVRLVMVALLVAASAGAGVAVAADLLTTPGDDRVVEVAPAADDTHTGPGVVRFSDPPIGADQLSVHLVCLTPGTFRSDTGFTLTCGPKDIGSTTSWTQPISGDLRSASIATDADARWRLSMSFASVTTTAWGTNESGESYGVPNRTGTPDLVAVTATNGRSGYVRAKDVLGTTPSSPADALQQQAARADSFEVPVFTSDGLTRIGVFLAVKGPATS